MASGKLERPNGRAASLNEPQLGNRLVSPAEVRLVIEHRGLRAGRFADRRQSIVVAKIVDLQFSQSQAAQNGHRDGADEHGDRRDANEGQV